MNVSNVSEIVKDLLKGGYRNIWFKPSFNNYGWYVVQCTACRSSHNICYEWDVSPDGVLDEIPF